jgi:hypothetical protein
MRIVRRGTERKISGLHGPAPKSLSLPCRCGAQPWERCRRRNGWTDTSARSQYLDRPHKYRGKPIEGA